MLSGLTVPQHLRVDPSPSSILALVCFNSSYPLSPHTVLCTRYFSFYFPPFLCISLTVAITASAEQISPNGVAWNNKHFLHLRFCRSEAHKEQPRGQLVSALLCQGWADSRLCQHSHVWCRRHSAGLSLGARWSQGSWGSYLTRAPVASVSAHKARNSPQK